MSTCKQTRRHNRVVWGFSPVTRIKPDRKKQINAKRLKRVCRSDDW